jgi:hypothetical protein
MVGPAKLYELLAGSRQIANYCLFRLIEPFLLLKASPTFRRTSGRQYKAGIHDHFYP